MSRLLLTLPVAAALVAGVAAPAAASPTVPYTCREARAGGELIAFVCFGFEGGLVDTTVTPVVMYDCAFHSLIAFGCGGGAVAPGTFGFVPNPSFPTPMVDVPTATVKSDGGTVGTLYYGTSTKEVAIEPFCVGDPAIC